MILIISSAALASAAVADQIWTRRLCCRRKSQIRLKRMFRWRLTPRLCRISLPQPRAARESLATWVCNRCDSRPLARDRRYHCAICNNGDYDVCDRCFRAGATCLDPAHHLSEPAPEPDVAIEDDVGKVSILPCVACYRSVRYLSELHRCATCHSDNAGLCASCLRNGIWCADQAHELTRSVLQGNDTKDLDPIDRIAFENRAIQSLSRLSGPSKKNDLPALRRDAAQDGHPASDSGPDLGVLSSNRPSDWTGEQDDVHCLCDPC